VGDSLLHRKPTERIIRLSGVTFGVPGPSEQALTASPYLADRTASLCAAIALCLLAFLASPLQARPIDDVTDSGYIRIFVYEDYAPYSWEEDGELKGIDVDIARRFAESLGVELRFLVRGADENIDDDLRVNIWKGDLIHRQTADLMMHVPYDQEVDARNELAVLMGPYFNEEMAVVADKAELPEVTTFGYFVNTPIGVEVDTASDFFLSNAFRGQLHSSIRRGTTFADTVQMFHDREVAAVMASRAQAEWIASSVDGIEAHVVQPPMPGLVRQNWPVGYAIMHDSRDLGYMLAEVVEQMIESGELAEICARYGVTWLAPE